MVSSLAKLGICTVLVVLSVLLTKGFSYSLPSIKPVAKRTLFINSTCTDVKFVTQCRPCTGYEKKYLRQCLKTGNVEELTCNKTDPSITQSCPFATKAEMTRFWVFQACMVSLALLSNGVVWWRRNSLNVVKYQRLKRQISDAV